MQFQIVFSHNVRRRFGCLQLWTIPRNVSLKKSEENSSRDSLLQVFLSYSHCPSDKWCLKNRRWIYVCTHEDQIRRIMIWWKKFQKFFIKQIYSCFFQKSTAGHLMFTIAYLDDWLYVILLKHLSICTYFKSWGLMEFYFYLVVWVVYSNQSGLKVCICSI